MKFAKAVRTKARLRLAITGPSGSGKTIGALMVAKGLGGKIALIDTEKGSASLYAAPIKMRGGGTFIPPAFDVLELSAPYTPERYREAIAAAQAGGYDCLIVDSTTHEWNGVGGCLELVDEVARAKFRGNSWSAWNDVTPRHRAFIDAMLQTSMHVIATGRSKTETAQTEGPNGKKQVVKLGMKTEQRDGFEYEFTTVLDLIHDGHFAVASKDRTGLFTGDPKPITEETGRLFFNWLETGAARAPDLPDDARPNPLHDELLDAADNGTAVLTAAHARLQSTPGFGSMWLEHGKRFKAIAATFDKSIQPTPDPTFLAVMHAAPGPDPTPPDEPANVDAAGTFQG